MPKENKYYTLQIKQNDSQVREILLKTNDTSNLTRLTELKENEAVEIICVINLENGKEILEIITERKFQNRSALAEYYFRIGKFCNEHHFHKHGIDFLNIAIKYNIDILIPKDL